MSRKPSRARKFLAKTLLIFLGFLFGAVIAEIALRIAGYSYPEFYRRDEVVGVSLVPGASGWYRKEGESFVAINSDGLRDIEHTLTKPKDTFRIALLGDSYCEAFQVPMEQAFWSVMAQKLDECHIFTAKVEVLNFGVSGYGTAQELLTLKEKVWKYSPDLIVLAVTTNNDITDNTRALKKTDDVPYFVYQGDQLVLDNSFRNSKTFRFGNSFVGRFGHWWRSHSRLVEAVVQGSRGLRVLRARRNAAAPAQQTSGAPAEKPDMFARLDELGADNLIYLEPNNAVWNDAWRVTEGLIRQMRDDVAQHGKKFLLVTLSNGPQLIPDPAWREGFKKRLGITDLFYPDNRIKEFANRENIPVITLAPDLVSYADQTKEYLHGFGANTGNGHWNLTGHQVAGALLAKKICEGALPK